MAVVKCDQCGHTLWLGCGNEGCPLYLIVDPLAGNIASLEYVLESMDTDEGDRALDLVIRKRALAATRRRLEELEGPVDDDVEGLVPVAHADGDITWEPLKGQEDTQGECKWFLECHRQATTLVKHPILGEVQVCVVCYQFATEG